MLKIMWSDQTDGMLSRILCDSNKETNIRNTHQKHTSETHIRQLSKEDSNLLIHNSNDSRFHSHSKSHSNMKQHVEEK